MAGQADGASADEALAAATDTPDTGTAGGNIHLAQAPGPVTDAPPPAAGSVPAGAPVAGAAVVGGGIPTGLLIAGGVIGVAAAAGAAAGGDSTPADTTAPTVTTVAITSATGLLNSTLNAGDVVSVTVTLSEATTVTGTPQLALNIGGATVQANYAAGSGTTALVFTYTILAGDDANGIGINANSLTLNGGTLRDAAGNNATLTHALVADNAGYKVDTTAPTVTISDDEAGTANLAGGDVTYTFQFNEAVTGFDATDVAVVNGVKGTFTAVDADTYTLAVTPNASLEGNLTVDVAAGAAADTAGNNSTAAAQSVQAVDTRAPTVTSVTIANGPYSLGETVTVTVLFNEAVTVAGGTPTLALDIGGTAKQAAFTGGSGTNTLTFSYVVEAGLTDTDGIDATANGITLGAATIRDAAGNPATLTYGLAINAPATVDTTAPTAPAAPTVAENAAGGINAAEAADGTPVVVNITGTGALAGDTLTVNWGGQTATYTLLAADILANSAAVTVPTGTITTQGNGTFNVSAFITDIAGNLGAVSGNTSVTVDTVAPTVTISDDEAGTANIAGGDVVYTFQFSEAVTGFDASDVTVVNGVKGAVTAVDADTYTLAVTPNANLDGLVLTVDVAGGAAADTAGNNSTAAAQSMQLVDTRAPTVTSVTIADGAYAVGETVTVSVIFSEPVTLAGGVPTLALNIGGTAKVATYASSPGSTLLTFSYVVETGLTDTDGIDATANGITLGAATIKDAAGNDATLTYALVNNAVATVDTTAPTAPAAPAAPTVAENGAGGINAAEASDGTPVVVNIAGTGALAGDTLTVNWG
ncbi:MAG: Ig-like domain-containing protein, partial [Pseudomonadota bacterium]|nr:Ig-like domain-containing protein [Pseudomonadota bacterium]